MVIQPAHTDFHNKYLLDVYCFPKNDGQQRKYWLMQFSFGRDNSPKGILAININGGV
jgi:hypothetical protein